MSVNVQLWGGVVGKKLTLAAIPHVGDSVVVGDDSFPVLEVALLDTGGAYIKVGEGALFEGFEPKSTTLDAGGYGLSPDSFHRFGQS